MSVDSSLIIKAQYDSALKTAIMYMLSWKTRERVAINKWLKDQLDKHKELLQEVIDKNGLKKNTDDYTIVTILRWVQRNIKYTSDKDQYKTAEYWASVNETLGSKKGDCEDMAVLVFCLGRTASIPAYKLMVCAGTASDGIGHSWVRYISEQYPAVQFYLDAVAYFYDDRLIKYGSDCRQSYFENKDRRTLLPSNAKYKYLWFWVNDEGGCTW